MAHLEARPSATASSDVPRRLTWPMVADMRAAGFTIGSHTKTHVSLPMETPEAAADELAGSKRALEQHLGEPIVHFAYPGGQFTPGVVDAVARAGYQFAYTACPHGDPRHPVLTIERLLLWEGSSIDADGGFSPADSQLPGARSLAARAPVRTDSPRMRDLLRLDSVTRASACGSSSAVRSGFVAAFAIAARPRAHSSTRRRSAPTSSCS